MPAEDIDDVVRLLGVVVDRCRTARDRRGYFAGMYLSMSAAVRRRAEAGAYFDDPDRMARFAALFANRYLHAMATFDVGGGPTRSWRTAFACNQRSDRLILQHVLMGINAHVNLDLGVAAAEVAPGQAIEGLAADFGRINDIIADLLDEVQGAIGRFSPLLDVLWRVDPADDEILNFSFRVARDEAWRNAVMLARQPPAERAATVDSIDRRANVLARLVIEPGGILGRAVAVVRHTERDDVSEVIDALATLTPSTV